MDTLIWYILPLWIALSVLAPQRVNEFTDVLLYEADSLVDQLIDRTNSDGQINPITTLQAASLNVILTTAFGQRVKSADDPLFIVSDPLLW